MTDSRNRLKKPGEPALIFEEGSSGGGDSKRGCQTVGRRATALR